MYKFLIISNFSKSDFRRTLLIQSDSFSVAEFLQLCNCDSVSLTAFRFLFFFFLKIVHIGGCIRSNVYDKFAKFDLVHIYFDIFCDRVQNEC